MHSITPYLQNMLCKTGHLQHSVLSLETMTFCNSRLSFDLMVLPVSEISYHGFLHNRYLAKYVLAY